jgi:hypothetical protein
MAGCTLTSSVDELTSGEQGAAGERTMQGGGGEGGVPASAGALGDAGGDPNPASGGDQNPASGGEGTIPEGGTGSSVDPPAGASGLGGGEGGRDEPSGTSGAGGSAIAGMGGGSVAGSSGVGGTQSGGTGGEGAGASLTAIYWLEHGSDSVWRSDADGDSPEELLALDDGNSYFRSLALDPGAGLMYFSDDERGRIQRANLDGSGVEAIITDLDDPVGLDLDLDAGKLYFVDQGSPPGLFRSNLDGSGVEPLITSGIEHPYGIALDPDGGTMYFVDNGLDALFRADLSGSNLTDLGVDDLVAPIQVALDKVGGKIYWTDIGPPPVVRRANLDGSDAETILSTANFAALSLPLGIKLDISGPHLYFVDDLAIRRSAFDGSEVETLLSNRDDPVGLALMY